MDNFGTAYFENYGAPFGPKVFGKNFCIGKNYFDSEKLFRIGKTLIFFLEYIALYRAVDVRILLSWCASMRF